MCSSDLNNKNIVEWDIKLNKRLKEYSVYNSLQLQNNDFILGTVSNGIIYINKEKEIELKYDLERNVKLVSFNKGTINISVNEKLNKNFIKKKCFFSALCGFKSHISDINSVSYSTVPRTFKLA